MQIQMPANLKATRPAQHRKRNIAEWHAIFEQSIVSRHLRSNIYRHDSFFGLDSRFRRTKFVRLLIAPTRTLACLLLSMPFANLRGACAIPTETVN